MIFVEKADDEVKYLICSGTTKGNKYNKLTFGFPQDVLVDTVSLLNLSDS